MRTSRWLSTALVWGALLYNSGCNSTTDPGTEKLAQARSRAIQTGRHPISGLHDPPGRGRRGGL